MAKAGVVCGVCGHKHPATPEGWVAEHISKRSGLECEGGRPPEFTDPKPANDPPEVEAPTEGWSGRSVSVRTVSGGLPGLGRRK